MSNPKDLDLLARCLSADWEARVEFFKKFLAGNAHLIRMAAGYRDSDEFLHDTFANVLRTGHSYDPETDLDDWVESVGSWTVLERHRFRDRGTEPDAGEVRISAAIEGDEPGAR